MPEQAYFDPLAYGMESLADRLSWLVSFIFIDGRMRGLFSFLFGASMLLVIERAEAAGQDPRPHPLRAHGLAAAVRPAPFLPDLVGRHIGALRDGRHDRLVLRLPVAAGTCCWARRCCCCSRSSRSNCSRIEPWHLDAAEIRRGISNGWPVRSAFTAAASSTLPPTASASSCSIRSSACSSSAGRRWATCCSAWPALKSGFLHGEWPRRRYARIAALRLRHRRADLCAAGLGADPQRLQPCVGPRLESGCDDAGAARHDHRLCGADHPAEPQARLRSTERIAAAGRAAFTNYLGTSIVMTALVLRLGPRAVRHDEPRRALAGRAADVGADAALEQAVARSLPLRPVRMAVAQPGALANCSRCANARSDAA